MIWHYVADGFEEQTWAITKRETKHAAAILADGIERWLCNMEKSTIPESAKLSAVPLCEE